ncbi:MAG: pilus assembly protein PilZ [Colwellia sp. Phe_37]|jgi:hypothetical protein|nr:MAG: pilus assembly protein PilZ [Colwellia sp. Phe_37]|tara:strand:+ start:4966 stop:5652 length:687 start_codon:yes stop_codon:yes gene_type:complete
MAVLTQQAPAVSYGFDLQPGKILDLEISHPVKVRIKVPLIGYEIGKYIILKYPISARISDYQDVLVEGNVVIARYILEGERGECYAFRSTIKHITKYPENFIILHYPENIESRQLRLQQRITTHLPASIMIDTEIGDNNSIRLNGIIADISAKGCGFAFKADNTKITVNKRDILICIHHPSTGDVKIPAHVCNSRNEQGKVSVGIKFFDDDEQVKNLLEHLFIDQNML